MRLELAWGKIRRAWLRWFRPNYVARMQEQRRGSCPNCPHDVVDYRDLKYYRNVCGWSFDEEDRYTRPGRLPFAPLGHAEIAVSGLLAASVLGIAILGWQWWHWPGWLTASLAFLAVVAWGQALYFFRDPERTIPQEPGVLVSPADGRVTHVEIVNEADFPEGRALRISIFLSIFDVHINRSPCAGRVMGRQYFPGRFGNALFDSVAADNEQFWTDFQEAETGQRVRVKQIAGAIARRIVCWLRADEQVERGQRIGLIKFGSRTDLLVPADGTWTACVRPGDRVRGGSSILLRRQPLSSPQGQGEPQP
jgi:phosphatidylserine decarboxylase